MAIDTTALNKLITDFRALSQKDSVSPESLGSLLQKLADLLASCPADSEVSNALNSVNRTITSLQSDLQNIARSAVTTDQLNKALKGKADDFAYYVDTDTIEFRPGTLKVASQQIAMAIADIVNSNKLRDKNIEAKADTANCMWCWRQWELLSTIWTALATPRLCMWQTWVISTTVRGKKIFSSKSQKRKHSTSESRAAKKSTPTP